MEVVKLRMQIAQQINQYEETGSVIFTIYPPVVKLRKGTEFVPYLPS